MPLSDTKVRSAKPASKDYKLSDEKGLYVLVKTNGAKYWRLKYRYQGKEKLLALGVYPDVTLKQARSKRQEARHQIEAGVDPCRARKLSQKATEDAMLNSFGALAEEWYEKQAAAWSSSHASRVAGLIRRDLIPQIGRLPVSQITAPELLNALQKIEGRGALEMAKRAKQVAGQIIRYAIVTGRAIRDPSSDLAGALTPRIKKHRAAITSIRAVGPLLNALDGYQGSPIVRAALKFAPLTFVRPGELRHARWADIDLQAAEWRFFVTKTKSEHIVPLSTQAMKVLRDLIPLTGRGEYVFPSARSSARPMSDNAVLSAMRRMDIGKDEMCGHGFRAMARTILDEELNFRADWIEHQLAHAVRDVHGRAYNRTAHLDQRKKMMQVWADYLDDLKSGKKP